MISSLISASSFLVPGAPERFKKNNRSSWNAEQRAQFRKMDKSLKVFQSMIRKHLPVSWETIGMAQGVLVISVAASCVLPLTVTLPIIAVDTLFLTRIGWLFYYGCSDSAMEFYEQAELFQETLRMGTPFSSPSL